MVFGLLIPLLVLPRVYRILVEERGHAAEGSFAAGTMLAMLLMGPGVYAAHEVFTRLSALAP